ncbi:hypothetical protein CH63R_08792 [Colletotrichum higginsianum IMI 349063]|uniref:Uncharacterized protein n=1 Tax=Colletotrichum higginsianum (strain IMI 349063) TaxID=759273 RepID=A0A1B7Y5E7_COLHI|nr:hypothetical protein CH63R_08792 [Colletotrichum higginsianum IMI 349063]OBR07271.1 hypothetical protein CH63R_08792 [Colletotrichum higginsianum IMI 349063]
MENNRPLQSGAHQRSSQESPPICNSSAYELEPRSRQPNQYSLDEPREGHDPDEARFDHHAAETHLLKATVSLHHNNDGMSPRRIQWKALGMLGLCIMGIGTLLIVGAIVFLGSFWQTSIRAGDGEIVHPQLWSVVVFSDWASRVVTITAAVLRICLALQMGVFTAMMASLMIERAGVPLTSAPLISILRAVSVSPYNLITWTTFAMPWRDRLIYTFSIAVSVLLAVGFQFSSTVLLSDFNAVNVTTPNKVADVLLSGGNNVDTDRETLEGSKLWNSPPPTYFRFAEAPRAPSDKQLSDRYEDTGHILRALLPFEAETSRSRLRRYRGPAAVLDSRVVCARPSVTEIESSLEGHNFDGGGDPFYEEFSATGIFGFQGDPDNPPIQQSSIRDSWPFNCVVPSQGTQKERAWVTSICSLSQTMLGHIAFQGMPKLPERGSPSTTMFLLFKGSGSGSDWQRVVRKLGNTTDTNPVTHSGSWEANATDWTKSTDGIWARVHLPETNYSMSVSACFTILGAEFLNVSMSSDSNGPEPSLVWDNATAQFNVDVIRNLYLSSGDDASSMSSRGILKLDQWEPEAEPDHLRLSAAALRLPFMNQFISDDLRSPEWPCGTLSNDSSRPLHYAHSVLFQDIFQRTGSLAEALQAVLMVTRQMEYYEYAPQVRRMWLSPASLALPDAY